MITMLMNEIRKLKRSDVIFVFFLALLFTDVLSAFQLYSGNDHSLVNYSDYTNTIIWDTFSLVLPAMIITLGNYLINIENISGSLKNNLTIPISVNTLYKAKILVLFLVNIVMAMLNGLISYAIIIFLPHKPELVSDIFMSMVQIVGISIGVFIAVLPIIIWFIQSTSSYFNVVLAFIYGFVGVFIAGHNLQDFYPITSFLKVINYNSGDITYHQNVSYITIGIWLIISLIVWLVRMQQVKTRDAI